MQSSVVPALPKQPNRNGGPPEITCTACSGNGFKTCTNHETGEKTQQKCTSCEALCRESGAWADAGYVPTDLHHGWTVQHNALHLLQAVPDLDAVAAARHLFETLHFFVARPEHLVANAVLEQQSLD